MNVELRICKRPGCGVEFWPGPMGNGRPRVYCTDACRIKHCNDRMESRRAAGDVERPRPYRNRPRRTRMRAKTVALKRLTREELRIGALLWPTLDVDRPRTRADCLPGGCNEQRPCPFVACQHHLYLDVDPRTGSIKLNFPDLEPWELSETCALDVAERGGITLEEVGQIMNVTRERVRQLEVKALFVGALRARARGLRG